MIYNPDIWTPDGPTYITESQTAFTNIETSSGESLTTAEKIAIDRFIRKQVLASNWSKIRTFVFPHLSNENKSRRDWFAIRDALNVGSVTWSQSGGWTTDGTNYINSQFVPSTDWGSTLFSNSQIGVYIIGGNNGAIFGSVGSTATNQCTLNTNANSIGNHLVRMWLSSSTSNISSTTSGTIAHSIFSVWRIPGSTMGYHLNGDKALTTGLAGTAFSNRAVYFGGRNNNGTFDQGNAIQIGAYWFTEAVDFDHTAWNEGLRELMQALGADPWRTQRIYRTGWEYNRYTVQPNDALIYWLGGQSNQNQYHNVSVLPYAFLQAVNNNAKVWNASVPGWQDLTPGTNGNPPDHAKGGIIERFAHTLSLYKPGQIYILSFAKSATGVTQASAPTEDWNINSGATDLYGTFRDSYLLPAIANLIAAGKRPMFMGIDWDQGEHEAGGGATTYQTDSVALLNAVINNAYTAGADCSRLVVLLKRLHNTPLRGGWPYQTTVRGINEDVGAALQVKLSTHACVRKSEYYNTDNDGGYIYRYDDEVHYALADSDNIAYARASYHASFLKQ